MKSTLKNCEILSGKRYSMEGNSATNLYCMGEMRSDDSFEGREIMKITAPFELLDTLRGKLPGKFDVDVEMVSGGKDKMVLRCLGVTPVSVPSSPAKAAS